MTMSVTDDDMDRFLRLLKKISDLAEEEHIKGLKFLLLRTISPKNSEKCIDMMDIFDRLMKQGELSPCKLDYLKELVARTFVGQDLTYLFDEYEKKEDNGIGVRKNKVQYHKRRVRDSRGVNSQLRSGRSAGYSSSNLEATISSEMSSSHSTTSCRSSCNTSKTSSLNLPTRFQEMFRHTALHIGSDWKILARLVEVPDSNLINIETQNVGNVYKSAQQVMEIWYDKQARPSATEFRKLLRVIPRNDIADDLREKAKLNAQ